MKTTVLLVSMLISGYLQAQIPQFSWLKDQGLNGNGKRVITAGMKGDVYTIYSYGNQNSFDSISRLDANGNKLWSKQCGHFYRACGYPDNGIGLIGSIGNPTIVGSTTMQIQGTTYLVSKLDENGNLLHSHALDNDNGSFAYIAGNTSGETFLLGIVNKTIQLGSQSVVNPYSTSRYFLLKLDKNYAPVWSTLLDLKNSGISDLKIDAQSNIYVGGYFFSDSLLFNNQLIMKNTVHSSSAFILKIDQNAQITWQKQIGGGHLFQMDFDKNGNLYLAGDYGDSLQIDTHLITNPACHPQDCHANYAAKLKPGGQLEWLTPVRAGAKLYDAEVFKEGYLYLTGETAQFLYIGTDSITFPQSGGGFGSYWNPYIVRLNSQGQLDWHLIPKNYMCAPSNISVSHNGNVYWTGFANRIVIGADTVEGDGFPSRMYLARFAGNPITTNIVSREKKPDMQVWPSPTNGKLFHSVINGSQICVYDLTGKCVLRTTAESNSIIDLSGQPAGFYIVQVRSEGKTYSHKIVLH